MDIKREITAIALSFQLVGWCLCFAQDIRLGPPIVELLTTPASTQIFYLNVINQSETDVECLMSVESMAMTETGMPVPTDSSLRSAELWFKFITEPTFIIKANETRQIQCTIRPPLSTEPGGYYCMVLARASEAKEIIGNQTQAKATIRIRFQMASVILVVVKGPNIQAKIEPEAPIVFGGNRAGKQEDRNWYVELPVRNDGNLHVALEGQVQILSDAGQMVRQEGLIAGRGYLLPGQRRVFKAEGSGPLPDGIYNADIRVGQLNIKKYATEQVPFYILRGQVYPGRPNQEDSKDIKETAQGFILDKTKIRLDIAQGGRRVQMVQLINITDQPLDIISHIILWDQNKDGEVSFPQQTKHGKELAQNITVSPERFTLKPKSKTNVKINFHVPKDAAGEYFDAILFNREGAPLSEFAPILMTQSVLASTKVSKTDNPNAELVKFEALPIKDKGIHFLIELKNLGNISISPQGRMSVFDSENVRLGDVLTFGEDSFLLPNNNIEYKFGWNRILAPGRYRVEIAADYYLGAKPLKEEFTFVIK